ncbi:hypothetical protein [Roseateles noduli]|uniref:hypothetical protein n=1 Tax=Roseateles noduli TaxID=2052484 RepID=UPI003D65F2CD
MTTSLPSTPQTTTIVDVESSMLALEYAGSILSQSTWFLPFAGEWAEFNGSAVKAALPDAQEQQLIQAISAGFLATSDVDRMAADALAESVLRIAVGINPGVLMNQPHGVEQANAVL